MQRGPIFAHRPSITMTHGKASKGEDHFPCLTSRAGRACVLACVRACAWAGWQVRNCIGTGARVPVCTPVCACDIFILLLHIPLGTLAHVLACFGSRDY